MNVEADVLREIVPDSVVQGDLVLTSPWPNGEMDAKVITIEPKAHGRRVMFEQRMLPENLTHHPQLSDSGGAW